LMWRRFCWRRPAKEAPCIVSANQSVEADRAREAYLGRLGIQRGARVVAPARQVISKDIEDAGTFEVMEARDAKGAPEFAGHGSQSTADDSGLDDFRQKYLRKLSYSSVWLPHVHRQPKHQTVVIFDWDDTLLCTSWLVEHGQSILENGKRQPFLRKIAELAEQLVDTAIRAGRTYIVTNAAPGWVEYSATRWVPELVPVLRRVKIISARGRFQQAYPMSQWKIQAFLELQRDLDTTPITNLLALGDAEFEMDAIRAMGDKFEEKLVKTIKFRPEPTPATHIKQLEIVAKTFEAVVSGPRSVKLVLEKKASDKP